MVVLGTVQVFSRGHHGILHSSAGYRLAAGIDFDDPAQVPDDAAAKKLAKEKGLEVEERHKKGDVLNLFFEEYCEEHMVQPTFVMDHPIEISPLTKKKPGYEGHVERFELFINGWEMCNAYSELNDPIDQRERCWQVLLCKMRQNGAGRTERWHGKRL